jgi:hypothetical protein
VCAFDVGPVQVPAFAGVGGDEPGLHLGQVGNPFGVEGVDAQHLRVGEAHLVAFEGLVVDEGEGVDADVDRLCDGLHGAGLVAEVDLGVEEVLGDAELLQLRHGGVVVVAAGDRVEDAALVEGADHLHDGGPQGDGVVLQQHSVPHGVVEVPHHAFDGRS